MTRLSFSVFLLALVLATSANATTLHYVGPEFVLSPRIGDHENPHVEARVVFSKPLTTGDVLYLSDISSFELSSAGRTISDSNATFAVAEFTIGSAGLPSNWGFVAEAHLEGNANPEQIYTHVGLTNTVFNGPVTSHTDALHLDDLFPNEPQGSSPRGSGFGVTDFPLLTLGKWTIVPEPSAMNLLALLVTTLLSMGRRLSTPLI